MYKFKWNGKHFLMLITRTEPYSRLCLLTKLPAFSLPVSFSIQIPTLHAFANILLSCFLSWTVKAFFFLKKQWWESWIRIRGKSWRVWWTRLRGPWTCIRSLNICVYWSKVCRMREPFFLLSFYLFSSTSSPTNSLRFASLSLSTLLGKP